MEHELGSTFVGRISPSEEEKGEVFLSEEATTKSKQRGKRCIIVLILMEKEYQ